MGANVGPSMANMGPMFVHSANVNPAATVFSAGGGHHCGPVAGCAGTSAGIILVLFILLVIILRSFHC